MKVGFIGAGNMASAMIGGIINSKLLSPSNIIASAKTDKTLDNIKEKYKNYLYIEVMPEEEHNAYFYEKHGFTRMSDAAALQIINKG